METDLNMQNSLVVFVLSVLDWSIPFLDKFHPKNQNCWFKLKFGTFTNWDMQNLM